MSTVTTAEQDGTDQAVADPFGAYLRRIGTVDLLTAAEEVELAFAIEAGVLAGERLDAGVEEDGLRAELGFLVSEGERARQRMIQANLRLVVSLSRRFSPRSRPLFEVVQDGTLGLIHAVRKFDYRRGCKFSTYAIWWIRQAITRGLADSERAMRLPLRVATRLRLCQARRQELTLVWGREPTVAELAEACDGTPSEIAELLRLADGPVSLDAVQGDPGSELLSDRSAADPMETAAAALIHDRVREALDGLPLLERQVVARRFGLDGPAQDRKSVAAQLGLEPRRVRRIEMDALEALRATPTLIALTDRPCDAVVE